MEEDLKRIKLVVIGDGAVGKTCLLISYSTGKFPEGYIPTVFDNKLTKKNINGEDMLVQLWDTAGQEDYDRLRPLCYPGSDVILLCYSSVSESSYEAISDKWFDEVNRYITNVPIVLVATKIDMRENKQPDQTEETFTPVSTEQGRELAEEIGAKYFEEISALTGNNLEKLFTTAIQIAVDHKYKKPQPTKTKTKKKKWF